MLKGSKLETTVPIKWLPQRVYPEPLFIIPIKTIPRIAYLHQGEPYTIQYTQKKKVYPLKWYKRRHRRLISRALGYWNRKTQ